MTSYGFAIVTISLSYTVFELFELNNIVTLKCGLESLKVIEIGAIRPKLGFGFLLAFYSNYGRICSRL